MTIAPVARLAAVALLVAACAGASPASVAPGTAVADVASQPPAPPTPSPTAVATSSQVVASASPSGTAPATASAAPVASSTPAPTPKASPTPAPRATPKPTARPTATAEPTAEPTATAKPTAEPVVLALEARGFAFFPGSLSAPADRPFGIAFTNSDAAIPHNVTIANASGAQQFSGQIVNGVASITYVVPALPAGTYRLGCVVHPAMTGTLTAG